MQANNPSVNKFARECTFYALFDLSTVSRGGDITKNQSTIQKIKKKNHKGSAYWKTLKRTVEKISQEKDARNLGPIKYRGLGEQKREHKSHTHLT